jgi:hypothetical protein
MITSPHSDFTGGTGPASPRLPVQFSARDIGRPELPGSAEASETGCGWDIVAGGTDIWGTSDEGHFVSRPLSGDFDIAIRVEGFTAAHLYSKAGLMIRETLDPDSAHLMFLVFASNEPRNNNLGGYEMQYREKAGGECQAIYPAVRPPAPPEFPAEFPNTWLRLKRDEDRFAAYASTDGSTWRLYAQVNLALTATLHAGPAVTSHNPQVAAVARFRDYVEARGKRGGSNG